jgi:hypothetical protein
MISSENRLPLFGIMLLNQMAMALRSWWRYGSCVTRIVPGPQDEIDRLVPKAGVVVQ